MLCINSEKILVNCISQFRCSHGYYSELHPGHLLKLSFIMCNDENAKMSNDTLYNDLNSKQFVRSKECYYEIKQLFLDSIPETHFPTFEEWKELVDKDQLHDPTFVGFKPGDGQIIGKAAAGFAGKVGMEALKASGLNMGTADAALRSMREAAEASIKSRINKTASKMFERFEDTGDGGTSEKNYSGGSRFNPTGLSQTLKPIDTSFQTDIEFQGQTRYWQDGKENSGPLFLKAGMPGLLSPAVGDSRDTQLWDFIEGPITMEWNSAISRKVTWTGRVEGLLTETSINSYINRCIAVCSIYYYWRSVIAFTDDPHNRNAGMDALRDQLTPDDYNNLFNLRREMMQSQIPPFIHEFCFYMFGTYRQNHLPTSPIMKLIPHSFASTSNSYFSGQSALVNGLSSVDQARGYLKQTKEFNNVLSRALGDWGGIEPFEYTSSPRVDLNFTTFWTNGMYMATNVSGIFYYPRIADQSAELVYNIHTDAPDGWVSSMVSPTVESTSEYGVGLFKPWGLTNAGTGVLGTHSFYDTNKATSCYMYNGENTAGFYPIESAQTYQALSGNTFNTLGTSGNYHKFQRFGTERVILTSYNALRQANYQFIDLLYTQDIKKITTSSGIRQGKEVSNSKNGNPYGGRKRGGKRRGNRSAKDDDSMSG